MRPVGPVHMAQSLLVVEDNPDIAHLIKLHLGDAGYGVQLAGDGRSAMAAVTLKQMGFNEVYSLAGGIAQWSDEKRPLLREATYV